MSDPDTGSQGQQIWFHPEDLGRPLIDLTDTRWGIQEDRDAMNSLAYMVDGLAQAKDTETGVPEKRCRPPFPRSAPSPRPQEHPHVDLRADRSSPAAVSRSPRGRA